MKPNYVMLFPLALTALATVNSAGAAVALDRTRVIVDGGAAATTLNIRNDSKDTPYLAQGWIEDDAGKKVQSPLLVVPPLQRMEPDSRGQLKVQSLPAVSSLPQDRESLYYFNLREVPPKSDKPNTMQLALQTRVKLFYRPQGLAIDHNAPPPQLKLTLKKSGDGYVAVNPTPYYITLVGAGKSNDHNIDGFEPVMLAPKSEQPLKLSVARVGNAPVLTYINDYGGRPKLKFTCQGAQCTAQEVK
ncbi:MULTISPECIES: fimbria/pilus periplasmic chaperone [Enterobacter]|uniref:fimbria/pilus periplasmic chaperone n=1 Tax=Enterobacter TaxID=547 RepID=UPI0011DD87C4|nr:fimbria/pilus periplasmic chaperone [Enterobacter bugandensis]QLA70624.1 fimbria/pilus periplasmic chaperone [Enterobacter pasteurii]HBM8320085.1 fimbria/pilus periplasmic chaperone [Enterobacter cloacae]HCM9232019.1 fimbria/pilus periplasmic chaperone [Enterobacter bugandensis]